MKDFIIIIYLYYGLYLPVFKLMLLDNDVNMRNYSKD